MYRSENTDIASAPGHSTGMIRQKALPGSPKNRPTRKSLASASRSNAVLRFAAAVCFGVASLVGNATKTVAQEDSVTAIDIALEPDVTMMQHVQAANVRLLKEFPKGFALDAKHRPHVTVLQQFVRTTDLEGIRRSQRSSGQ